MNAYELAQCLEDMADFDECEYTKAANMLRQQADRIAELEERLSFYEIKDLDSCLKPKPLNDEEIYSLLDKCIEYTDDHDQAEFMYKKFARAIEERHGIK